MNDASPSGRFRLVLEYLGALVLVCGLAIAASGLLTVVTGIRVPLWTVVPLVLATWVLWDRRQHTRR